MALKTPTLDEFMMQTHPFFIEMTCPRFIFVSQQAQNKTACNANQRASIQPKENKRRKSVECLRRGFAALYMLPDQWVSSIFFKHWLFVFCFLMSGLYFSTRQPLLSAAAVLHHVLQSLCGCV